jgi:hypothetical protein
MSDFLLRGQVRRQWSHMNDDVVCMVVEHWHAWRPRMKISHDSDIGVHELYYTRKGDKAPTGRCYPSSPVTMTVLTGCMAAD